MTRDFRLRVNKHSHIHIVYTFMLLECGKWECISESFDWWQRTRRQPSSQGI